MKKIKINEGRLTFDDYDIIDKSNDVSVDSEKRSVDSSDGDSTNPEEDEKLFKHLALQTARLSGNYEGASPEIVAAIVKYMPELRPVSSEFSLEENENTYYIDDDEFVSVHINLDNDNIKNFINICNDGVVFLKLIGSVNIQNAFGLNDVKLFPVGFPREIDGQFIIKRVARPINYNNAPVKFSEKPVIVTINKHLEIKANEYINRVWSTETNENKTEKHDMKIDLLSEARKRFSLGESFASNINEAMGPKLSALLPAKGVRKGSMDDDDFVRENNRRVIFDIIDPMINIPWGNLDEDKVTVLNDALEIAEDVATGKKDFEGIKIFTTKDRLISAVYAASPNNKIPKIVYLRGDDGQDLIDPNAIAEEINKRHVYYGRKSKSLEDFGITSNELPKDENATVSDLVCGCVYWALGALKFGHEENRRRYTAKTFDPSSGSDNNEIFDKVMSILFGNYEQVRENDKAVKFKIDFEYEKSSDNRKTEFVIIGNPSSNQASYKTDFVRAIKAANGNVSDIVELLSEDMLKAIAFGCGIRLIDEYPTYTINDIEEGSREDLVNIVQGILDAKIVGSAIKRASYAGNKWSKNLESEKINNPATVGLLFPDKMAKEYKVDVKIKDEYKKRLFLVADRALAKSGTYDVLGNKAEYSGTVFNAIEDFKNNVFTKERLSETYKVIKSYVAGTTFGAANLKDVRESLSFIPVVINNILDIYSQVGVDKIESDTYDEISGFASTLSIIDDKLNEIESIGVADPNSVSRSTADKVFDLFDDIKKETENLVKFRDNVGKANGEMPIMGKLSNAIRQANMKRVDRESRRQSTQPSEEQSSGAPSFDTKEFSENVTKVNRYVNSLNFKVPQIKKNAASITDRNVQRKLKNIDGFVSDLKEVAKFGNDVVNSGDFNFLESRKYIVDDFSELVDKLNLIMGTKGIEPIVRVISQCLPILENVLDVADMYYDALDRREKNSLSMAESVKSKPGLRLVESVNGIKIYRRVK